MGELFDASAYWKSGRCPWTFFAFPTNQADSIGLPSDVEAVRLLAMLQKRGIRVGIWTNSIVEDTTYFACPQEDIQSLHQAMADIESLGLIEKGFLAKRSETYFASRADIETGAAGG